MHVSYINKSLFQVAGFVNKLTPKQGKRMLILILLIVTRKSRKTVGVRHAEPVRHGVPCLYKNIFCTF